MISGVFVPTIVTPRYTLKKSERLCARRLIERLFAEGSSVSVFPVRIIYLNLPPGEGDASGVSVLFSVSKRRFKHAVCRNRVKRQLREMYRHSSVRLKEIAEEGKMCLVISLVWQDSRLWNSEDLSTRFESAMDKLCERLETAGQ